MTRFAAAQGFMGPFSYDGGASIAPYPPWHYAADFTTIECWVDPASIEALLPPELSLHPEERGLVTVSFVDWQACTDTGGELLDPIRSQYRECIVLASVQYEGKLMQYCPYIVVDQDTSLARGWALGYPKKIGSVWVTRTMGVTSVASPAVVHGSTFAGTVAVKDRRIAEGHVKLDGRADGSAVTFGSRPIVALRHFPSMFEGEHDRPAVFELVRLQAENVQAGPVWEGAADLTLYDSPTEILSTLRPTRIGRGWRYSLAMTNRNNHLLRDLRGTAEQVQSKEN
ncbi:acetoacetate decarboxylase family protein [Cupriavidus consociatus]|uniref:acetoacetate decarboxylase family protein n=1 Tax=Cupriavidus consociatus TaxID=2821357 RepID=UPI001AE704D9|nr:MULTISPECIES: acetoacetate decarboxylase family protein [unclassified Cupriavidus]MBP0621164.1 acetoacetate decarboxylase family protein [Cupriavidus sp. LEh25]MDK2657834.1 acetoacetate decarboxylase family protein [Cupriavidus sp. LEh21]